MNATIEGDPTKDVAAHISGLDTSALASLWLQIKHSEREIQQERVQVEEAIVARLGAQEEGAHTKKLENGLTVTITGKLTYKADVAQLVALCDRLPVRLRPVKTETVLDQAGAKYLRQNEPEYWKLIAPAIEVKPAKTAVSVKQPSSSN